jgi:hypothetical protein
MAPETTAAVEAALLHPIIEELVTRVAPAIDQAIRVRFPLSHGPHRDALGDPRFYGGGSSGSHWLIVFNRQGEHVILPALKPEGEGNTSGYREWEIALSCRGPILTASEQIQGGTAWEFAAEMDPTLASWARALAQQFGLHYVDAAELLAWQVDPATMTEEMQMRMDYTDNPSAFQLLFYE